MLKTKKPSAESPAMTADMESPTLPRDEIRAAWLTDESGLVNELLPVVRLSPERTSQISRHAQKLVMLSREYFHAAGGIDAFLQEYDLSSQEGVILMCLAEALLRIPDAATADKLIHDKLANANWARHLGHSDSLFVNASTWGLLLTGRLVAMDNDAIDLKSLFNKLISRSGEPVVRVMLKEAMHIIARQFVLGRDIDEALLHSSEKDNNRLYSFDMLGEAALTRPDADRYFAAYSNAIRAISDFSGEYDDAFSVPIHRPGISIKLSALHSRLEVAQRSRVIAELLPRLVQLCEQAMAAGIGVTIDAEESGRLELLLDVFEQLFRHPSFRTWSGIGLAVQAYQKRALPLIEWLAKLAQQQEKVIMLRLVKGAYWDTEIKQAQQAGLESYPVFTRKESTDISYLACVQAIRKHSKLFYPQFATHNAYTIAAIIELMQGVNIYEFQSLHGMGEAVYTALATDAQNDFPVRTYAPVGKHNDLLPYLVRRLLENGANTSFLNRFADQEADMTPLITPPDELLREYDQVPHPQIPLPGDLYRHEPGKDLITPYRANSSGLNLDNPDILVELENEIARHVSKPVAAGCLLDGKLAGSGQYQYHSPANQSDLVGTCTEAETDLITEMINSSATGFRDWRRYDAEERASILDKVAELLQAKQLSFMQVIVREGGRCIPDAMAEIREAIDFCRYYAVQCRQLFSTPQTLTGPTGEFNQLAWHPRGLFACISPWNFPLAIFTGQIAAALAAGNSVIAKPARQTPITAFMMVQLFHEAGVPVHVLQLLLGSGSSIGAPLIDHTDIHGIAFTGSTATARQIQQQLASRKGPQTPLIAETGGLNAMIVDSSALPEQVVRDAVISAFNSAGQRCSALRLMFVQDSILPRISEMLSGAMQELSIGDPVHASVDVGPVISAVAVKEINHHIDTLQHQQKLVCQCELPAGTENGFYVAPTLFELNDASVLQKEVFGPVLHLVPFAPDKLDQVIDTINASGYGLTLGIQSRIESTVKHIISRVRVGNIYVNRNMIGAVVGVQPFGGEGLSGTGPKAGGPNYLQAFATERSLSVNTAAIGGNTTLMTMEHENENGNNANDKNNDA